MENRLTHQAYQLHDLRFSHETTHFMSQGGFVHQFTHKETQLKLRSQERKWQQETENPNIMGRGLWETIAPTIQFSAVRELCKPKAVFHSPC